MAHPRQPSRAEDHSLKLYTFNPRRLRRTSPQICRSLSRLSRVQAHIDARRSELIMHSEGPVNLDEVRAILRGHRIATSPEELVEMDHRLHDASQGEHLGDD